jgi:hypothetical protein
VPNKTEWLKLSPEKLATLLGLLPVRPGIFWLEKSRPVKSAPAAYGVFKTSWYLESVHDFPVSFGLHTALTFVAPFLIFEQV